MPNIDEFYNKPRASVSDEKVLKLLQRVRYTTSMKEIDNKIDSMSWGAVYKGIKRLEKDNKLILASYIDDKTKKVKKGVFIDEDAKNEFMKDQEVMGTKIKFRVPKFYERLYELFTIVMKGGKKELENISKRTDLNVDNIQTFLLNVIEEIMDLSIDEIDKMEKEANNLNKGV